MTERAARLPEDPRTVTRILRAAEQCYERFGITKTTMDDIAKAAELSRATLYRTFSDRESLLTALFRQRAHRNTERRSPVIAALPSLREQLLEGIHENVQAARADHLITALVSGEHMALATNLLSSTGLAHEIQREFWYPILDKARSEGKLRDDVDIDAFCLWIAHLETMFITQFKDTDEDDEQLRLLVDSFVTPAVASVNVARH